MSNTTDFIDYLAAQYRKEGWEPEQPEAASTVLNFSPDLLLRRRNEYLVVDVKEAGYKESRALQLIRKVVEKNDGWKFEVKVIPPDWQSAAKNVVVKDVDDRIEVAKLLARQGHDAEAFILSWTAVEGLLRESVGSPDPITLPLSALIRKSYENAIIDKEQIQALEAGLNIRNRLVHGMAEKPSSNDVNRLLDIASRLAEVPA